MANGVMASLSLSLLLVMSLVLFDQARANAGVDLPEKEGTEGRARVSVPREYEVEAEVATGVFVFPDMGFRESLQVNDGETSEAEEEQTPKADDESEVWVEVSSESIVPDLRRSGSDSSPLTVLKLGRRRHDCRHKPWFRELPRHETESENDESSGKAKGEDMSFESVILRMMRFRQGHGHRIMSKRSSDAPGGDGGAATVDKADEEESKEENLESQQKEEDEKQDAEEKAAQTEKEDAKSEPAKPETEPKEEDDEPQKMDGIEGTVQSGVKRILKLMNF